MKCFLHIPTGCSRAEVAILSCQQLLKSFRRKIQEFPGSQKGSLQVMRAHGYVEREPVPRRSLGQILSLLRKPDSCLRVAVLSPTIGCFTYGFMIYRKNLSPDQMKCDFQAILTPVWIGDFACDVLLGESLNSGSYKHKPCSQSSRTFHISVSVCFDCLLPFLEQIGTPMSHHTKS